MSPASRFDDALQWAARLAPVLAVAAVAWMWRSFAALPALASARAALPLSISAPPATASDEGQDWSAFRNRGGPPAEHGALAARFRLAGTFFAYGSAEGTSRKAVLDDLKSGQQRMVIESEVLDDVTVVRILRDHVVLRSGGQETELWLGFAQQGKVAAAGQGTAAGAASGEETDWLGGRRVGENRWIFSRAKLMDYYSELQDEPDRMVKVFDSLKPMYDTQHKITGYQLGVEGEPQFFDAVGLKEGDVVRSVNSMKMTNRSRAEYFIREFAADRANVFVLDVERDGQPTKLVYEVH